MQVLEELGEEDARLEGVLALDVLLVPVLVQLVLLGSLVLLPLLLAEQEERLQTTKDESRAELLSRPFLSIFFE